MFNLASKNMNKMKNLKWHAIVMSVLFYAFILYYTSISDIFIIGRIFGSICMTNLMSKYQSEMFMVLLRY